ncbi:MAG: YhbY family RNA-binding protein [Gammaproteobacteria bacterium]|jgi:RNA-binding protein|nr:YhbY family RNA-binding protein [Gammaproteobacteria bacterium]MBP6051604.1 YhbY family RNA-binding protein [Pseudomonadales bacterium]MBK6581369.1 YhbY family RNA-binding protein [Gammaproteobacteria bacterium]MBK7167820.1 YhbY family RNA-binding protein [Gammaproteobacteria bacterium]MBK7518681.1 YhbY family RNA-binding protein [Gammaproteobacteria bacterium]
MALDPENKKRLRGIGHALHPLVTVAGKGLSESVCLEAERALHDHELIKIRFALPDRNARRALAAELIDKLGAELVQEIGKVILIYRRNPKAHPKLSNLRL